MAGSDDWLLGSDRRQAAVGRIEQAAAQLFLERGIEDTTAEAIARRAGCSRATLYRLVGSRTALVDAVLAKGADRITARLAGDLEGLTGAERATTAIISTVAAIRAEPVIDAWLRSRAGRSIEDLLGGSGQLVAVAELITGSLGGRPRDGEWIVRLVLGLVLMPGADEVSERELVEAYVVPALLAGS